MAAQRTISFQEYVRLEGFLFLMRRQADLAGEIVGDRDAICAAVATGQPTSELLTGLGIGIDPMKDGE